MPEALSRKKSCFFVLSDLASDSPLGPASLEATCEEQQAWRSDCIFFTSHETSWGTHVDKARCSVHLVDLLVHLVKPSLLEVGVVLLELFVALQNVRELQRERLVLVVDLLRASKFYTSV